MQIKRSIIKLLCACLCAGLLLAACKKDDMTEKVRMFRPVIKAPLASEGNWIEVSWQAIKDAQSYTVQISTDTFKTVGVSAQADSGLYVFENLAWDKMYWVRVRANATDTVFSSKWATLGSIKTMKFPTILKSPAISDLTQEAVRIRWASDGAAVTSLKVKLLSDSSFVKDIPLTSDDVANEFKVVDGLKDGTAYLIYLYSGTTIRGWETYKTKAKPTGTIIDLRTAEYKPSLLADTLPDLDAGSIVLLKRGQLYEIGGTINLAKSLTIMSAEDFTTTERATILFKANFNIVAGSVIDLLSFSDLNMYSDSYTGRYVFNINAACTIGKIQFEACSAKVFRGFTRLQSAVMTVSEFVINNCVLDSIADYGVVNVDNANCKINDIKITNSTISRAQKVVAGKQAANTLTMENLTFNEAARGGNFIVDFNGVAINTVSFKNNIIGVGLANGSNVTVNGIRISTGNIETTNNYATKDFVAGTNPIAGLTPYAKNASELFTDPANANFKIKDNTFPGRATAGDPRWRP
ncbi:DUF5123 domain-containing protein [Paraflavitalea pollutisoli]|uniref:DUF5123 domain-containing protein n=1 Tax=Paraflavitalea pollutisoli TaxID=3034143 RepID=UPI0023ED8FDF|nr:DUF5123 domain-containing protein [Paraflavitalea sp. H1-2-19X]